MRGLEGRRPSPVLGLWRRGGGCEGQGDGAAWARGVVCGLDRAAHGLGELFDE